MYLDILSQYIVGLPQLIVWLGLATLEEVEEGYFTLQYANVGAQALHLILLLIGAAILPYLLGSVSIPRFYCRHIKGVDVYAIGGQKGELLDVWRHVGKGHAIACFALEILKVLICLALGYFTLGRGSGADGAAIAAFFCILGDALPVWHKMRGTRGFEIAAITVFILAPLVFAVLLLIYLIVLLGMRFSTAARLFPVLLYPLIASAFMNDFNPTLVLLSVGVVAVMLFTHWKNIRAMMERQEPRLEFGKKKKKQEEQ
jgi:glycerol-3-phosphate acyltransferase PlsY